MSVIHSTLSITRMNYTINTWPKIVNTNNKLLFLDVFINTNNSTVTTFPNKKPTISCTLNYKIAIIKNLKYAKLIFSTKIYSELKNIKQTLINKDFSNHAVDGLVCCWVLWHNNLCRVFNTKSIFM